MQTIVRSVATAAVLAGLAAAPAVAQKKGGTFRLALPANPVSLSIHEEASIITVMPVAPIFNNLVMFDPLQPRNTLETVRPELAESWSWDDTGTKLTFKLRQGVKWHDGKPFTAKDVQCTWHRLNGKEEGYFRKNPRKIWYENLKEVTTSGDFEATFHFDRPKPAILAMLASGFAPVYPCHVAAKDMRTNPIGTGPFKLISFRSNENVRLERNPEYWRKGLPYFDALDFRVVGNRATRVLGLVAGEFDMTSTGDITVPLMKDVAAQAPKVICELAPANVSVNVLVNPKRAPFDSEKLRRAMALALDREGFIKILSHGASRISGAMMALPDGEWGMPKEVLETLPGYGGTLAARQAEARKIMEELGYGPSKKIAVKVTTRDFAAYKDPAVILVDQLNQIHFAAELEIIESSVFFGRAARQDYSVTLNLTGTAIDDPDVTLMEVYSCKSENNFAKYCKPEVEQLLAAQSTERDKGKRKELVWKIERILAEDVVQPIIYHGVAGQCRHPYVRGHVRQSTIYNNWRLDEMWFDK